jgi:hypothetical protein
MRRAIDKATEFYIRKILEADGYNISDLKQLTLTELAVIYRKLLKK